MELQLGLAPVLHKWISVHRFGGRRWAVGGGRWLYASGELFVGVMMGGGPFIFWY